MPEPNAIDPTKNQRSAGTPSKSTSMLPAANNNPAAPPPTRILWTLIPGCGLPLIFIPLLHLHYAPASPLIKRWLRTLGRWRARFKFHRLAGKKSGKEVRATRRLMNQYVEADNPPIFDGKTYSDSLDRDVMDAATKWSPPIRMISSNRGIVDQLFGNGVFGAICRFEPPPRR